MTRRIWLASAPMSLVALCASGSAWAGGQLEEPLVDSVRSALSAAIANSAPPIPEFADTEARLSYLRWMGTMSFRLRRSKPDFDTRREFLQTAWYESRRAGLDVSLVLGLIQVESAFRKYAVSPRGRARLHAGHAVLDTRDRRRGRCASCFTCRPTCASAA
jgi:soluble lytic murein transglycosylase-like protein